MDLISLELLVGALLLLAAARPFVKAFRGVAGLTFLPFLATAVCLAVFPAFGFRPELVPLGLVALAMALGSLPRVADLLNGLRTDDYGDAKPARLAVGLPLVIAAAAFAVAFAPRADYGAPDARVAFHERELADAARGATLRLRVYPPSVPAEGSVPVVLLSPPASGGFPAAHSFCADLARRGFAVAAFRRAGPGLRLPSPGRSAAAAAAFFFGHRYEFAASAGARIEQGLLDDFRLVAERLAAEGGAFLEGAVSAGAEIGPAYAVGFGSGGSAAALLVSGAAPAPVLAAVCIEGRLHTAFASAPDPAGAAAGGEDKGSGAAALLSAAVDAVARGTRDAGFRAVGPSADAPKPAAPVLFIVSDSVADPAARDGRYAAVLRALRAAAAPAALASMAGAGAFSYSDAAGMYPLFAAFSPPSGPAAAAGSFPVRAAALCAAFLRGEAVASGRAGDVSTSPAGLRLELGGPWTASAEADILRP